MANQVELTCNVRLFVPTLFCSISPTFHTSQIGTQMQITDPNTSPKSAMDTFKTFNGVQTVRYGCAAPAGSTVYGHGNRMTNATELVRPIGENLFMDLPFQDHGPRLSASVTPPPPPPLDSSFESPFHSRATLKLTPPPTPARDHAAAARFFRSTKMPHTLRPDSEHALDLSVASRLRLNPKSMFFEDLLTPGLENIPFRRSVGEKLMSSCAFTPIAPDANAYESMPHADVARSLLVFKERATAA